MLIWVVVLLVVLLDVSLFCILGSKINNLRDELLGEHFRYRKDFTKEILSEVHRVVKELKLTAQMDKEAIFFDLNFYVGNLKSKVGSCEKNVDDLIVRIEKLEKIKYGAY